MNFTPQQLRAMIAGDQTLSSQQRGVMLAELDRIQGFSMLTPGRLYSMGLSAVAGWLAGAALTGTGVGGTAGAVLAGIFSLGGGGGGGFSLDHRSGW